MRFRLKWPFRWPWRRKASPASPPAEPAPPVQAPAAPPAEPVRAEQLAAPATPPVAAVEPDVTDAPDLGHDLLQRAPLLSTPPTLGAVGGLGTMAQALPAVQRFMAALPSAPQTAPAAATLSHIGEFTAWLPGIGGLVASGELAGLSALRETLPTPASLTDMLPPLGALPGQWAALSGAAPEAPPLPPAAPSRAEPVVVTVRVPVPVPVEPPPVEPTAAPPAWTEPEAAAPWPLTQVLPPEATLTGNVLVHETDYFPVQRAISPVAGAPSLDEFVTPPGAEAGGERLTAEQRAAIESQRGQGRPLDADTRERFEQAFGQPLGDVRVHTGPTAHQTATSLNAIAFATGRDLFFTQNMFSPETPSGLSLLGHELAHVVQQQYGLPGDSEQLRPAGDPYELQADLLAARALEAPLAGPAGTEAGGPEAPVQRLAEDAAGGAAFGPSSLTVPPSLAGWTPGEALEPASSLPAGSPPLAGPLPPIEIEAGLAEPAPVQRFGLGDLSRMAGDFAPSVPQVPDVSQAAERVSGLTNELPNAGQMLGGLGRGLGQRLPSLGDLGSLPGQLPNLGNLPSLGSLTEGLPSLGGLPEMGDLASRVAGLTDNLPSLGGLTEGLPSLGGLAGQAQSALGAVQQPLQQLGGLRPPDMPLPTSLGEVGSLLGGAVPGAQEALGSITSMAPSMPDVPAMPQLPSMEKLADQVWKHIQQKLKVERERSRGLA